MGRSDTNLPFVDPLWTDEEKACRGRQSTLAPPTHVGAGGPHPASPTDESAWMPGQNYAVVLVRITQSCLWETYGGLDLEPNSSADSELLTAERAHTAAGEWKVGKYFRVKN